MITVAANVTLDRLGAAGMPSAASTLNGWLEPMALTIVRVTQTEDFTAQSTETDVQTLGCWQPLSKRRLEMKPEGERSWEWWMLHVSPELILRPGEFVKHCGVKYRVMGSTNYSRQGYIDYELINAFTHAQS